MPSLFEFNDAYIAAVVGGLDDNDTVSLFQSALEEAGGVVEKKLRDAGIESPVVWDEDGWYVELDEDEAAEEFGAPDVLMNPKVRQAVIQSRAEAERSFKEVLNA